MRADLKFEVLEDRRLLVNQVSDITFDPMSPADLDHDQNVNLAFNYETDEGAGVRIWARPMTGGNLSPDYAAHGSALHEAPNGQGTGFFTITAGDVHVDQVRIQMWDDGQTELLHEIFVDVDYDFGEVPANQIFDVQFDPISPASLANDEDVNVSFSYTTDVPEGVRIWAQPFTNGQESAGQAFSASPLHPAPGGDLTKSFTILNGTVHVDQVRIQMWTDGQGELLHEIFVDVDYDFGEVPANQIFDVQFDPISPASLANDEDVNVSFSYTTDVPEGVRIWAQPFTNGQESAGQAFSASPLHPAPGGDLTKSFTILNGTVHVDQVRIQMWTDGQGELLHEIFVDVDYDFGEVPANQIFDVQFDPISPASLANDEDVNVSFSYTTDVPEGVRIWAQPFTNGQESAGQAFSASPLHPAPGGDLAKSFTILNGTVHVDQVRIQMWTDGQGELLHEIFVDVDYDFGEVPANQIFDVQFDPISPASLANDEDVNVSFSYTTDVPEGVRIWAQPFTNGQESAGQAFSASPLHPAPGGDLAKSFTILNGTVHVDQVRIQMWTDGQGELLHEIFVDVDYDFGEVPANQIFDVQFDPISPASLANDEDVNVSFSYTTDVPEGVRIWAQPFTNGQESAGQAFSASPLHPAPGGDLTKSFTILNGTVHVDQVRIQMWTDGQGELLHEIFVDVDYDFAAILNSVYDIQFDTPSPSILEHNDNVNVTFKYTTGEANGVRIFARPMSNGNLAPNYAAHGSSLHAAPSGDGTGFFTITTGDVLVDQVRFQMWDDGQNNLLFETFVNVNFGYHIDSDGDGLYDRWESFGLDANGDGDVTDPGDLNLPSMGADPLHKDLFLEFDWMTGHAPQRSQVQRLKEAFALAPIDAGGTLNPDGQPGINLWVDTGSLTDGAGILVGDNLGGGNSMAASDIAYLDSDFYAAKTSNFNTNRRQVFRYAISARGVDANADGRIDSGGWGEIGGNDFIEYNHDAGTIMHELGHTLNLRHGGNENKNRKPNYVSVMNYDHQFGIPQVGPGTIIDYSPPRLAGGGRGNAPLPTLNEANLNENIILDATDSSNMFIFTDGTNTVRTARLDQRVDWNGDGDTSDSGLSVSIEGRSDGAATSILTGHDDWTVVSLGFRHFGDFDDGAVNPVPKSEDPPTLSELFQIQVTIGRLVIGDSNFDGVFNSSDLVTIFGAGEYEDKSPDNSTWEEGDWNGDDDFDSGDLVHAFQFGNYSSAAVADRIAVDKVLGTDLAAQNTAADFAVHDQPLIRIAFDQSRHNRQLVHLEPILQDAFFEQTNRNSSFDFMDELTEDATVQVDALELEIAARQ